MIVERIRYDFVLYEENKKCWVGQHNINDEGKLKSEVWYEDGDNCGSDYPHIYGFANNDAVMQVLPFLKNEDATWIRNPEFADIQDKWEELWEGL